MALDLETKTETMILNMGPHHPSTHGVLRLILELDGERVVRATPDIGYLHTGVEKMAEYKRYYQIIPLVERLDYPAALSTNLAYVLAVERLLDLEVPLRAQYLRVLLCELQRLASHLLYLGSQALDVGVLSTFPYCFREREMLLDLFEMISGSRMMPNYIRVGGLARDIPSGFQATVGEFLRVFPGRVDEYEDMLTTNRIWLDRTVGIGVISADEAINMGMSGPSLRACGVNWDIRKAHPYSGYERFDFEVPIGGKGDVFDRYMCRVREIRQSLRLVEQALDGLPSGPVRTDDRKVVPPPKEELATSMEALIHHFKLFTEGFYPPAGEVYFSVESPKGELGFYIISDGSGRPYRMRIRPPSFFNLQSLPRMLEGHLVADAVAIIASIDIVLGEVDR